MRYPIVPRSCAVAVLLAAVLAVSPAQESKHQPADETKAQVPVLSNFHEVIFQIWHTAWPEKNVTMLRDLLPEVQRYRDSLSQVQLPGILRDKQKAWDENVAKLRTIVADYERAASPIDSVKLLDAAERLHAQYEVLVRTIRPALKEVDAFHQVLYMLYHHYWPDRNQEKVASSLPALKEKMTALNAVVLPERWKKKDAAFKEACAKLTHSVEALTVADAKDNPERFSSNLEAMHADYQALERVFQ